MDSTLSISRKILGDTPIPLLGASGLGAAQLMAPRGILTSIQASILQDFTVPSAWPVPFEIRGVDDCGAPQTSGRVVTTFSNGDPPLSLLSLKDGRWQGIWFGNVGASKIGVTANADRDVPAIRGTLTFTGTLQSNEGIPAVTPGGSGTRRRPGRRRPSRRAA
jgi:hypothetical protein